MRVLRLSLAEEFYLCSTVRESLVPDRVLQLVPAEVAGSGIHEFNVPVQHQFWQRFSGFGTGTKHHESKFARRIVEFIKLNGTKACPGQFDL